jgi:transcriptional regulator with XRE-family HTH domain
MSAAGAGGAGILGHMSQTSSAVGPLLQYWRHARRKSQLELAHQAGVSPRHLSFLETGRASPSREMVVLLAGALDVPLRERNAMLLAAGFAPLYRESRLEDAELAAARAALEAILRKQEPWPAVVMDRGWDVVTTNRAAERLFAFLLEGAPPGDPARPANVIRLMFDPAGLRPRVANWQAVAESLVQRMHREAVGGVADAGTHRLLEEALAFPGVPRRWRRPSLETPSLPVVPVRFERDGRRFDYFSTVTTLGTPQDVTLQELRIECFFPLDEATERAAAALGGGSAV